MNVSNQARSLADRSGNSILHSEAISMVLKGEQTDIISDDELIDEYESKYIKELFMYIDDKDIKDAVYDSFYDSKLKKNLVYVYNNISDVHKKARVRILTRMLWYNLIGMNIGGNETMEEITKKRGRKRKNADIESIKIDKTIITENALTESETKSEYETPIIEEIPQYDPIDTSNARIFVMDEEVKSESNAIDDTIADEVEVEAEPFVTETVTEVNVKPETVEEVNADTNGAATKKKRANRKAKDESVQDESLESDFIPTHQIINGEAKDCRFVEGMTYTLPFARLYRTSVAKQPIGVCLGEVEILSTMIHDHRVNVFDHGRKIAGWIDTDEITGLNWTYTVG